MWILFEVKNVKKIYILLVCLIIILSNFTGCVSPIMKAKHPSEQENTTWMSENGNITFYVGDEPYPIFGEIVIEDEIIDVWIRMSTLATTVISVYQKEGYGADNINEYYLEGWSTQEIKKDKLVVTVYRGNLHEEGTEIVFHRVEE